MPPPDADGLLPVEETERIALDNLIGDLFAVCEALKYIDWLLEPGEEVAQRMK